jgi:hypothetical protein
MLQAPSHPASDMITHDNYSNMENIYTNKLIMHKENEVNHK